MIFLVLLNIFFFFFALEKAPFSTHFKTFQDLRCLLVKDAIIHVQWSLTYPDPTYPDYSLIWTHVWEPIPIPQQKVPHFSGSLVIRTCSQSGNRGVRISEARL